MQGDTLRLSSAGDIEADDHIDMADSSRLEQWASRLGIASEHLRELIARVGPRASDVMAELSRPDSLD